MDPLLPRLHSRLPSCRFPSFSPFFILGSFPAVPQGRLAKYTHSTVSQVSSSPLVRHKRYSLWARFFFQSTKDTFNLDDLPPLFYPKGFPLPGCLEEISPRGQSSSLCLPPERRVPFSFPAESFSRYSLSISFSSSMSQSDLRHVRTSLMLYLPEVCERKGVPLSARCPPHPRWLFVLLFSVIRFLFSIVIGAHRIPAFRLPLVLVTSFFFFDRASLSGILRVTPRSPLFLSLTSRPSSSI